MMSGWQSTAFALAVACTAPSTARAAAPAEDRAPDQRSADRASAPAAMPRALRQAVERTVADAAGGPQAWPEQKLSASDGTQGTNFGYSLAISGSTAFVSAYQATIDGNHAQGAVYVYAESDGIWTEAQKLTVADGAPFSQFGESIAFDGTTALISANGAAIDGNGFQGAVYIFSEVDGLWTQATKLTAADGAALDNFGWSVAISGTTAVIGAPYADVDGKEDQGATYVFTNTTGTWEPVQRLTASDGAAGDNFGRSVAVDAATALVGAVSATVGGNELQGAAYVFEGVEGSWAETEKLIASDGDDVDNFGQAVALSGTTALIGAPIKAAAYVFGAVGGEWTEMQKLTAADGPGASGYFGYALAFDGATMVIGALNTQIGDNIMQGAAYVFDDADGSWQETRKLVASDGAANENLGMAVGVSGATAVVGAYYANVDGNAAEGAAYLYTRPVDDTIFTDGFEG
jgi:hypothetical protein